MVRRPVRSNVPSASTAVRASTDSLVTPYFVQCRPPALVAMFPPMLEISWLAGSGAYIRSCLAAARSSSAVMTPGSTTAISSSGEISRIRFSRSVEMTSAPLGTLAPPESPVPRPRGTTGTANAVAPRNSICTSGTDCG